MAAAGVGKHAGAGKNTRVGDGVGSIVRGSPRGVPAVHPSAAPSQKGDAQNGKVAARPRQKRREEALMALMEEVAYGLGDNSVNFWSLGLRLGHLAAEIPHREGVYRGGTRAAAGAV